MKDPLGFAIGGYNAAHAVEYDVMAKDQHMKPLDRRKCLPCEGGVKPLSSKEIKSHLCSMPNWRYDAKEKTIRAEVKTKDFMSAIRMIRKIARLAERAGHHPDLHLTGYRHLAIVLTTHAIQGLSINDLILAAKIDKITG